MIERLIYFLNRFCSEQGDIIKDKNVILDDFQVCWGMNPDQFSICGTTVFTPNRMTEEVTYRIKKYTEWGVSDTQYKICSHNTEEELNRFLEALEGKSELNYKKVYDLMKNSFGKEYTDRYKKMKLIKKLKQ